MAGFCKKRSARNSEEEFVDLAGLVPFARGGNRWIYEDPRDERRALKVIVEDGGLGKEMRKKMGLIRYVHHPDYYDENHRQWRECKRVGRKFSCKVPRFLSKCFGFVRTDEGVALVVECARNADGTLAINAEEYIAAHGWDARCRKAFRELRSFLMTHRIHFRDARPGNIAMVVEADGSLTAVIIDGLGNSEFIPLSNWIPLLGRRKIAKRWQFLMRNIRRELSKRRPRIEQD